MATVLDNSWPLFMILRHKGIISVYIKKWNEKDEDLYSHNKRMDVYRRKCMETMVKGREILIDKTKKLKKWKVKQTITNG